MPYARWTLSDHFRRGVGAAVAAIVVGTALAGCGATTSHPATGTLHTSPQRPHATFEVVPGDEVMPAAPQTRATWLAAVDHALALGVQGRSPQAWLRQRAAQAKPGERLAVVLGVDDVIVQTHYAGLRHLVPATATLARRAQALGYTLFYVTGRSDQTGLTTVRHTLATAGILGGGLCGQPASAASAEQGKVECRAAIVRQGYTLALSVAASELSFDGAYPAEVNVPLPDFSVPPTAVS